jgi:MarR family 2-MHQ and catechol resistance regulon transcriptional repressor
MPTHYQGSTAAKRALDVYIKLDRAAGAVSSRINQHLADYSLTVSQFGVLEALYHLGPLRQKDLAQKILKSTGNITLVIDNLVKRKLVTRKRDKHDRRAIHIHLTEAGSALIDDIFPKHVALVEAEMSILSMEEQDELQRLCRKLGLQQP